MIESTETDQEEIVEIEEIVVEEEEEDVEVPFAIIEDIPIFPGCEKVSKKMQRKCFEEKIHKHVVKNFRYPSYSVKMYMVGRL